MGNLGDKLRDARQRQQLSLDEVEAAIKIRKKYLIALEQEDLDRLPAAIFAKGFVRSYASYLGLDADALVALLPEPEDSPHQLEPAVQLQKPPRAIGSWLVVVVIIAMVGAVGIYLYQQGPAVPGEPEVVVAIEFPTPTAVPTTVPSPTAKVFTNTIEVQVRAVERTWLSVSVDSKAVFTGTLEIGDNLAWTGLDKVVMRVGNAGGLEVAVNDQRKGLLGRPGQVFDVEFTTEGQKILTPTPRPTEPNSNRSTAN